MARFTKTAIEGAAEVLFGLEEFANLKWADVGEADKDDYRENAEKILNGARGAIEQIRDGSEK